MREIGRSPEVVLKDAAAHLERVGWVQAYEQPLEGSPTCIIGAITAVCHESPRAEWRAAKELVAERLGTFPSALAVGAWNDKPGRTVDEVLRVLRGES